MENTTEVIKAYLIKRLAHEKFQSRGFLENPQTTLDPLFYEAAELVVKQDLGSTSLILRHFNIGYNRAGKLIDLLYKEEIVGNFRGSRPREVLVKTEQLQAKLELIKLYHNEEMILSFYKEHEDEINTKVTRLQQIEDKNLQEIEIDIKVNEILQGIHVKEIEELATKKLTDKGILTKNE